MKKVFKIGVLIKGFDIKIFEDTYDNEEDATIIMTGWSNEPKLKNAVFLILPAYIKQK